MDQYPSCSAQARAFLFLLFLLVPGQVSCTFPLSPYFYKDTCPEALDIVRSVVQEAVQKELRMAASLLRLHFHDCFVNGCDGSILLDDTEDFIGEKTAFPNVNSVRGFGVVDRIKKALEIACPFTVSCADILAIAARDSVVLVGGPYWPVFLGRRDSTTASADAANQDIPAPFDSLWTITSKFQKVGLNDQDVVTLSGAHTIGRAHCDNFISRLYNFSGNGEPDPTLDQAYREWLQNYCPQGGDDNTLVPLDPVSRDQFDNQYYKNLQGNKGLLQSDQELYSNAGARNTFWVNQFASNVHFFFNNFGFSMVKMGNIGPLTGTSGQIRRNCRVVN